MEEQTQNCCAFIYSSFQIIDIKCKFLGSVTSNLVNIYRVTIVSINCLIDFPNFLCNINFQQHVLFVFCYIQVFICVATMMRYYIHWRWQRFFRGGHGPSHESFGNGKDRRSAHAELCKDQVWILVILSYYTILFFYLCPDQNYVI